HSCPLLKDYLALNADGLRFDSHAQDVGQRITLDASVLEHDYDQLIDHSDAAHLAHIVLDFRAVFRLDDEMRRANLRRCWRFAIGWRGRRLLCRLVRPLGGLTSA